MKNKNILLLITFVTILLTSCDNKSSEMKESSNNKYLVEYSGGYTIEILNYSSNDDAEVYALHENGNAKIMSEKIGIWTAEEGKIKITIQGNTGPIVEEYVLKNGIFVSTLFEDHYLKHTK